MTPDELTGSSQSGLGVNRDKIRLTDVRARSFIGRMMDSPLTAAWLLAIAISSLIAVLALAPKYRFAASRPGPPSEIGETSVETAPTPELDPGDSAESPSDITNQMALVIIPDEGERVTVSVSALEPENIAEPLHWPPLAVSVDTDATPDPSADLPPLPIKIDVETKLKQKLVSYKQTKPVSRRDLIEALQEHLGAPIRYDNDELGAAELDKTITFEIENTTVGGVIKNIADTAGWEIHIEDTGLRLTRKS